jgi:mannosyltransferase OCH1-like enzyme
MHIRLTSFHRPHRPPLYYFLLTLTFLYLLHLFSPLIQLLITTPTHTLKPSELLASRALRNSTAWRNSSELGNKAEKIPRIVHQTWKNESIPRKWQWSWARTRNMTRLPDEYWAYMVRLYLYLNFLFFLSAFDFPGPERKVS